MRSKTPLAMMEQALMLLVFALAAALCLRAFVWSDSLSRQNAARDRAVVEAQNAAELLKHTGGNFATTAARLFTTAEGDTFTVLYDEDWNPAAGAARYRLTAEAVPAEHPLLGAATVRVEQLEQGAEASGAPGETLFEIPVRWQKEG
ncbi:MAG: hypothetical protein IJC43_01510 [Clostridia bacterium]|nr:hypothetical protein [Clostridia bacterium]